MDGSYNTSQRCKNPVTIAVRKLSVKLKNGSSIWSKSNTEHDMKQLLYPLTLTVDGGTLFAVMGGSGSGKTSLLNIIAGRYDPNALLVEGVVKYSYSNCRIGYVSQKDELLEDLTVFETLMFVASMKMNSDDVINDNEDIEVERTSLLRSEVPMTREDKVRSVLLEIGLDGVADALIGSSEEYNRQGLSGGERKRVSLAMQLISDPDVMCVDEPTSGLDSFTSTLVMEVLNKLSKLPHRRATVLCSIHQPRENIFNMFDKILILSRRGHAVYCGSVNSCYNYFSKLGYDCPKNANPADYFID
eukprot:gene18209-25614_t